MKWKNKLCHRFLSVILAFIMVFSSLSLDAFSIKAKADNTDKKYSVELGLANKTTGNSFKLSNAMVTASDKITNLTITVTKGSIRDNLNSIPNVITDIKPEGKHQTATWWWDGEGADAQTVQNILKNVEFDYESGMTISVTVDGNMFNVPSGVTITSYRPITEHNNHYYMYVTFDQAKDNMKTQEEKDNFHEYWNECYNLTKSYSYQGYKGYLTSVTSEEEDKVLDNITNKGAWSAGARIPTSVTKVDTDTVEGFLFDTTKHLSDVYKYSNGMYASETGTRDTNRDLSNTAWYWTCGPEAGKMMNNENDRNGEKNQTDRYLYHVQTGDTNQYHNWCHGEPNDYTSHNDGEWCMFIHYDKDGGSGIVGWNDYPSDHKASDISQPNNVSGFFVEFSDYENGHVNNYQDSKNLTVKLSLDDGHTYKIEPDNKVELKFDDSPFSKIPDDKKSGTLELIADDMEYTGLPYDKASLEGTLQDPFYSSYCDIDGIYFEGIDGTTYEKTKTAPKDVGTYKAYVTITDKETGEKKVVEKKFKIGKPTGWNFKEEDGNVVAEYESDDDNNGKKATLSIEAPSMEYTGLPYDKAQVTGDLKDVLKDGVIISDFKYRGVEGTVYPETTVPPTEIGEYEAVITVTDTKTGNTYTAKRRFSITDHDWSGEWVVTKEPTATEEGKREKICKNGCGTKLVETIPCLNDKDSGNGGSNGNYPDNLIKNAEVMPGSPVSDIVFNNKKKDLIDNSDIFTTDEKNNIYSGIASRIWLVIKSVDVASINETDKNNIDKLAKDLFGEDNKLIYFDVSMFKKIGTNPVTRITRPGTDISVTITVPSEIANDGESTERNYKVIRLHEGEVTAIDGKYNAKTNELTFLTDRFSTYAIGYSDKPIGLYINDKIGAAVKLQKSEYTYTGSEIRPNCKVYYYYQDNTVSGKRNGTVKKKALKENVDYVITYTNNVNAGEATLNVKGIGDYSLDVTKTYTILKKDAKAFKLEKMPVFKANGQDLTDLISSKVIVYDKGNVVDPSEYGIKIDGDTKVAGSVTVTVSVNGLGNYRGLAKKAKAKVKIVSESAADIDKAVVTVVSKNALTYTGKFVKPKVKVTIDGKKVPKKYFNVVYKNNINAGEASVYVIGKGKGTGISKAVSFTIVPKDIKKVKVKKYSKTYWRKDLKNIKPIIKNGKTYLTKDVDYIMEVTDISEDKFVSGFSSSKKLVAEIVIKPSPNNPNYADYSSDKSGYKTKIYITKRDIKSKLTTSVIGSSEFKDGEYKPVVEVKYGNDKLVESKDYTIKYKIKKDKKTGLCKVKATIKGIGLYQGSRVENFSIYQEK